MKTLIVGLGNPILGDDGVGWKVVGHLASILDPASSIETDCVSLGGLSLMERMLGYEHVVLIDAVATSQGHAGRIRVCPLSALANPLDGHSASAHDTSLTTALETARAMGLNVPVQIDVVAIEAGSTYDFSDQLSPLVERAVPIAAEKVLELLRAEVV